MEKEEKKKKRRKLRHCSHQSSKSGCSIDKLPDDVISSILSNVTIKEAVRTSVLSRRWRHLWRRASSDFIFDLTNSKQGIVNDKNVMRAMKKCMKSQSRQTSYLDKFIIRFNFNNPRYGHKWPDYNVNDVLIRDWIRFAIQKKVRVLQLAAIYKNHQPDYGSNFDQRFLDLINEKFTIPREIAVEAATSGCCFGSLTSLKLDNCKLEDEVMDYFLSNSPSLQNLSLIRVGGIKNLNIVHNPRLEFLSLRDCKDREMEKMKISAENLASFEYFSYRGNMSHICFENAPRLKTLIMGDTAYLRSFTYETRLHRVYSKQLENIVMHLSPEEDFYFTLYHSRRPNFPSLRSLKQLEMFITTSPGASFLYYVACVGECRFLSNLSVQFLYEDSPFWTGLHMCTYTCRTRKQIKKLEKRASQLSLNHLKVVRLTDFNGDREQVEFAEKLVQMCKSLEKLIIKPKRADNSVTGTDHGDEQNARIIVLNDATKQMIAANLGANVGLVIE
ncbi:OLC1v1035121C1 [Oldenlandia corymbosa var. corymbosa]|uniref:OLC1v1035121C1 n=1 Tax=Oldenlandia corymbosa var. corymbosa TaxID=529605 RepID=A0AAV1CSB3_OLDCO|nr:OLC1v1035121C1 [Oldenlandia corymbosa var. corymbosa]